MLIVILGRIKANSIEKKEWNKFQIKPELSEKTAFSLFFFFSNKLVFETHACANHSVVGENVTLTFEYRIWIMNFFNALSESESVDKYWLVVNMHAHT